ncbi:unnamed protein product [Owenia fusiformis]|uniref:Uncharacterized protein n=1 Tax=Owenia fusiformis TaxID=6347 RepID=A0A8S4PCX7_OWEFU|nr:unnamed protein product [Owenia fusiformis]
MNPIFQEDVDFIPSKILDKNHQQVDTRDDDVFHSGSPYDPIDNLQKSPRKSAMKKSSIFEKQISESEATQSRSIPIAPAPPPLPNTSQNSQPTIFQASSNKLSPPKARTRSSISFTSETIDNEGKGKRYKSERLDIGMAGHMDKIRTSSDSLHANQAFIPDDNTNIKGGLTDDEKANGTLLVGKTDIIQPATISSPLNHVNKSQETKVPTIGIGVIKVPPFMNIASVTVTDPSVDIQVNRTPPTIGGTPSYNTSQITQLPSTDQPHVVMQTNDIYLENNPFQNGQMALANNNGITTGNTGFTKSSQNEQNALEENSQYRRLVSKVEQRKRHLKACKITWFLIGLILLVVIVIVIIFVLLRRYGRI